MAEQNRKQQRSRTRCAVAKGRRRPTDNKGALGPKAKAPPTEQSRSRARGLSQSASSGPQRLATDLDQHGLPHLLRIEPAGNA